MDVTVNLLQLDEAGKERITSIFQVPEEKEFMEWVLSLEMACPGTTIFIHRLSDFGHYLCMVPSAHPRLCEMPDRYKYNYPPRLCGCFNCVDQRANRDLIAWNILPSSTYQPLYDSWLALQEPPAEDFGSYGT